MVTRKEYLAGSLSRQQPWLAEGIGRRQWERRRRKLTAKINARSANPSVLAGVPAKGTAVLVGKALRRQDEDLLLRRIHAYLDAQGIICGDAHALAKAIHTIIIPERLEGMNKWALIKVYRRARARLPEGYDQWIALVMKWDKSYTIQRARDLVDCLVAAIGNRPRTILRKLFEHLDRQFCENWSKKVKRLESDCERLEKDEFYMPQMRELRRDDLPDQIYAELESGPRTKTQLAKKLRRTRNAILAAGQHLRDAGLIEIITNGGRFMWARTGTAPPFVLARDAIIAALKEGPMNVTAMAEKTGKSRVTVVKALQSDLLPKNEVMRTGRGIYALFGTEPPYVSKGDAILSGLKTGPMNVSTLCQVTGMARDSLYTFIQLLLARRKIIRTGWGVYALRGAAPLFVTTDEMIIRALRRRSMGTRALVKHVNRSRNVSEGTVVGVLTRLKKARIVKHDGWGGEYHLRSGRRLARREDRPSG
jgi:predicted transcriptional regulator